VNLVGSTAKVLVNGTHRRRCGRVRRDFYVARIGVRKAPSVTSVPLLDPAGGAMRVRARCPAPPGLQTKCKRRGRHDPARSLTSAVARTAKPDVNCAARHYAGQGDRGYRGFLIRRLRFKSHSRPPSTIGSARVYLRAARLERLDLLRLTYRSSAWLMGCFISGTAGSWTPESTSVRLGHALFGGETPYARRKARTAASA
jgi:hypothetical protein